MQSQYFIPPVKFKSRRQYRRTNERKYGKWFCIRLSENALNEKCHSWCDSQLANPWGNDFTGRRFYFSNMDEALLFKLKFGGD